MKKMLFFLLVCSLLISCEKIDNHSLDGTVWGNKIPPSTRIEFSFENGSVYVKCDSELMGSSTYTVEGEWVNYDIIPIVYLGESAKLAQGGLLKEDRTKLEATMLFRSTPMRFDLNRLK